MNKLVRSVLTVSSSFSATILYGMDGMHEFYINNGWPNAPFQGGLLGTARLLFVKKSRSAAHREYGDRHPDPKPIHKADLE